MYTCIIIIDRNYTDTTTILNASEVTVALPLHPPGHQCSRADGDSDKTTTTTTTTMTETTTEMKHGRTDRTLSIQRSRLNRKFIKSPIPTSASPGWSVYVSAESVYRVSSASIVSL